VRRGIPFVVAAPSGTGKTTVCRRVVEADPEIIFSVSHTTREIRPGEREGFDYHFVDESRFEKLVDEGGFLEHARYNDRCYGTSWRSLAEPLERGLDVVLEIEVQGASQVRERREDARFIFLLPPSMRVLRQRLESRGTDAPEQIERRLARAREELDAVTGFDYAVVNDDLERCIASVREIIAAERCGAVAPLRERFDPVEARERLRGEDASGPV
jgi:guanylate kinase